MLSCLSLLPFAPSEGFACGESDFVAELYASRERFGDCLKVHQTQKRHVLSCRFASIHAPSEGFACGESDFVAELYACA